MAKKKIYLSAAAHAADNPTKCLGKCSENTHCNAYMDIVEKRLKQVGFDVKRGSQKLTGDKAMSTRVKEANKWKADLYYVAHTNAGGGRYSMTMCWPDAESRKLANILHKYRTCVSSHKVVTNRNLYEINQTAMPCLYDELFFHDNAEDCKWFHSGGMEKLAEETVRAICEICGVEYTKAVEVKQENATTTVKPKAGDKVVLKKGKLYASSTGNTGFTRTATFYLYDGVKVNGRYRVTNSKKNVGKTPLWMYVSGWVKV